LWKKLDFMVFFQPVVRTRAIAKGDLMSNPALSLPARPSLEQLRKQAKELLKAYRAGDSSAVARFQSHHPRITPDKGIALADAQLMLAREYGFQSWAKLKHHVESLQRPADFDEPLWGRDTWPFLAAVYRGDESTVREMLARDPSLANAEYAYLQPLHYAVRGGRIALVRLLLDAGADPLAEGWSGKFGDEIRDDTPLARARDRELDEIVTLLEKAAGDKPRSVAVERKAPLTPAREIEDQMMQICHRGEIEAALEMIDRHPELAQAGLYEAVHQNHPDLVRILLERGAKATTPWRWACWYTPLMHSLRYGAPRYDIAQLLLDHGVDPNETNGMGMTTLHIVAGQGTVDAARWLLDRGADIHARDREFDSTPLAWAGRAGREDMARFLLSRGASVVHPDDEPWATPIAWARRRNHPNLVSLLGA
jgi:ankyrin repeat protein